MTDFVMVRFATKPYSFMRVAASSIRPWLDHHKIQYTQQNQKVYFTLPGDLEEFVQISPELGRKLAPFSTEIKRRLSALQWTRMKIFRQRLSEAELQVLADNGIPIIL